MVTVMVTDNLFRDEFEKKPRPFPLPGTNTPELQQHEVKTYSSIQLFFE
jgi:hypothetical protein